MGSNAKTDVAAAARRLRERVPGSSLLQTSNFSFLQLPNSKTNQPVKMAVSKIRQNYHEDCEALINKQINMEFYASYVYLSMSSFFNRDDQALHGFAEHFKKESNEDNNSTLLQKPLLGNLHSTKELVNETAGCNHDAQLHSVLLCDMEKRKKRELSYNRNSKVWTSTEKLKKEHLSFNLSEHLKSQTHLQSEELSELSESGSDEEFLNAHNDVD